MANKIISDTQPHRIESTHELQGKQKHVWVIACTIRLRGTPKRAACTALHERAIGLYGMAGRTARVEVELLLHFPRRQLRVRVSVVPDAGDNERAPGRGIHDEELSRGRGLALGRPPPTGLGSGASVGPGRGQRRQESTDPADRRVALLYMGGRASMGSKHGQPALLDLSSSDPRGWARAPRPVAGRVNAGGGRRPGD